MAEGTGFDWNKATTISFSLIYSFRNMAEGTGFDWNKATTISFSLIYSFRNMAEGTGFEPAVLSYAGFQDQCHQPLGHPSTSYYIILFRICVGVHHVIKIIYGRKQFFQLFGVFTFHWYIGGWYVL